MISMEEMQVFLPSYLSAETKEELFGQLAKFGDDGSWQPFGRGSVYPDHLLQGDGIRDMVFSQLPASRTEAGNGLILSNTCDIDRENQRKIPARVIYCPLIEKGRFEDFVNRVYGAGAEGFLRDTRAQQTTNIIYFPEVDGELTGFYGLLDRVINIGLDHLPANLHEKSKIFTLSQVGFYLFLIKLSIHFTRMQEGIARG